MVHKASLFAVLMGAGAIGSMAAVHRAPVNKPFAAGPGTLSARRLAAPSEGSVSLSIHNVALTECTDLYNKHAALPMRFYHSVSEAEKAKPVSVTIDKQPPLVAIAEISKASGLGIEGVDASLPLGPGVAPVKYYCVSGPLLIVAEDPQGRSRKGNLKGRIVLRVYYSTDEVELLGDALAGAEVRPPNGNASQVPLARDYGEMPPTWVAPMPEGLGAERFRIRGEVEATVFSAFLKITVQHLGQGRVGDTDILLDIQEANAVRGTGTHHQTRYQLSLTWKTGLAPGEEEQLRKFCVGQAAGAPLDESEGLWAKATVRRMRRLKLLGVTAYDKAGKAILPCAFQSTAVTPMSIVGVLHVGQNLSGGRLQIRLCEVGEARYPFSIDIGE